MTNYVVTADTTLDDAAKAIAGIYQDVTLASFPLSRWSHIVNDATILGEDVRRGRTDEALTRTGRIVMRLLDYVGYYLYTHPERPPAAHGASEDGFSRFFSEMLRYPCFEFAGVPAETISHWIMAKYPGSCSKCGEKPCHCVLRPWVFENRRENAGDFQAFREKVDRNRNQVKSSSIAEFSTISLVNFFGELYRNSYSSQDEWKLTMHLTEELGEATTELVRLEMAYRARDSRVSLPFDIVRAQCATKLSKKEGQYDAEHVRKLKIDLEGELGKLKSQQWDHVAKLAARQFKEEVADVFSWLSAIVLRLTKGNAKQHVNDFFAGYSGNSGMKCCFCDKQKCSNECLLSHAAANEVVESALHL